MRQEWFEMAAIRRRFLANSVWIPLRAIDTIEKIGAVGYVGYKEEFFGAGSLAVRIDARDEANEHLGWMDVGIAHSHGSYVQDGTYVASDTHEIMRGGATGIPLVLEQRGNRDEPTVWHLHQDFVIALRLKREEDLWICPDEAYVEVVRLSRKPDGSPRLLEVRAEHLRDYLCARRMALYVTSYRNREVIVDDASHITWKENPQSETSANDRWEGRVVAIHEGGMMPFGAETAVFHVARNDVDPEVEVPAFGLPQDGEVSSKSWTKKQEGKRLFRIEGELWRTEWIDPAEHSPRIRGDELPPSVFFTTDAEGKQESKATLQHGVRWLWFRPEVMMALTHRRGGRLEWYTRDTGGVNCSPDYNVHFGVNKLGLVCAYAKDIALLPEWQQRVWAGFNVGPDGGVSEELLDSQMKAEPASTKAPEALLDQALSRLNDAAWKALRMRIVRDHEQRADILKTCHRFRAADQSGLFALAKDLARLTADSLDASALQKVVSPPPKERWGSLKSLEKVLAIVVDPMDARDILGPLVGVFELRHADAHLPRETAAEALRLLKIDPASVPIDQGYQLLQACVGTLFSIADIFERATPVDPSSGKK